MTSTAMGPDDAARAYLFGRLDYERRSLPGALEGLGIGRMRRFLRRLGDPQADLPLIHIAGSKGKGSTAAMIAAGLAGTGRKVGLYSSPHLHTIEERFQIAGQPVDADVLTRAIEAIRPIVEACDDPEVSGDPALAGLTFFELCTALGLMLFRDAGCDAAIIEVGLGGRLDSTNAIRPELGLITSISLDHTRQLGDTLEAIAGEKAGIIKRGLPTLSGVAEPGPAEVIRRIAARRTAPLAELDREITLDYLPPTRPLTRPDGGLVRLRTPQHDWGTVPLPLLGPHQARNLGLALAAADLLDGSGSSPDGPRTRTGLHGGIDRDAYLRGIAAMHWPARAEVLGESPWLVLDGAHNAASAAALAETLRLCFPPASRRTIVFGTSREKDLDGQLRALAPICDRLIATQYQSNPRALAAEAVVEAAGRLGIEDVALIHEPEEALALARRETPPDGLICVTGSLFLVAELRGLLTGRGVESRHGSLRTSF